MSIFLIDAMTLQYLGNGYYYDARAVYYGNTLLPYANGLTFRIISAEDFKARNITKNITDGIGYDWHFCFMFGKIVEPISE